MSNPQFQAKIIASSRTSHAAVLTTIQLLYPRFIHAEVMTHRVFSRNASSSRAIPVAKVIEQVRTNPAMPIHWGKNQPGMKAREEVSDTMEAIQSWKRAARQAADVAEHMAAIGLHKQVANRILEPFQLMSVIVTATEWYNFFQLRDHPDADPNIALLAQVMKNEFDTSEVTTVFRCATEQMPAHFCDQEQSWHLPYISEEERSLYRLDVLLKASTARCARVSYNNHDGSTPDIMKDCQLHDALVAGVPIHASPAEHQAVAVRSDGFNKNFRGWVQYRTRVERSLGK